MNEFAGWQVLVVGLGASGAAAARVLSEGGAKVRVSERRYRSAGFDLDLLDGTDVEVLFGGHQESHLDEASLVVTSPGVPEHAPILQEALRRGLPVWSELEVGARVATGPYLAVTGTNGKTTTTEMVAAAMRAAGLDAVACGNIGHPFSLAAREGHDALVVEASSFQLRFHDSFHPRVSVLLNVAPDHLDWHRSLTAYRSAKARVYALQGAGDAHVGNRDDAEGARISRAAPCTLVWFRLAAPDDGEVGYRDGVLVSRMRGREAELGEPASVSSGFRADAAAAAAAALAFGIEAGAVREGIASIQPLPHRGRVVATVDSVRFVDDSKATNPHATLAALEGLTDVVLIAGGLSKGVDLSPLVSATPSLAGVIALGEAAPQIEALFEGSVTVRRASSVEEAAGLGLDLAPHGGTVLLAPACASQDMFRDYRERGDRFAAAARRLASREGAASG